MQINNAISMSPTFPFFPFFFWTNFTPDLRLRLRPTKHREKQLAQPLSALLASSLRLGHFLKPWRQRHGDEDLRKMNNVNGGMDTIPK